MSEDTTTKLNPKQEEFCKLYVDWDKDLYGNWVQCYIEVYKPDQTKKNWYKTACAASSRMLSNVKVCERISNLLEEWWLNDQFVDKQLLFLIQQYSDFWSKMRAIWEYNKMKNRINNKLELTGKDWWPIQIEDLSALTPKQLDEERQKLLQ